jgi:phosphoglycolate phosphatase/AHBA synthesis associated protein
MPPETVPVRAVLFDLDGVLVDSYQVWFHLLNGAARELGYPLISAETFRGCWGQGIEADVEKFFTRHSVAEMERYYEAHFRDHLEHLGVEPEVPHIFATLRKRCLCTAVITNTPAPIAWDVVKRTGGTPDLLVGGTDVPHPKPAPDMVLRACELLAIPALETLVVGDSRYDREAARAAGACFAGLGIEGDVRLDRLADVLRITPVGLESGRCS